MLRVLVLNAADRRILAFDVLAHDVEIYIPSLFADEWAGNAVEQANGPQVHVLIEFTPDRDQ